MKKILLTLAATAMCATAFAGTRVLYQQTFDQADDAAATGWSYGGGSMTIASDEYGKFLELALGQNNGRSGQVTWGKEIFYDEDGNSYIGEDGIYNLKFDFSIKTMSNNQYNSEITVFTNHTPTTNQTYRTPWSGNLGPWSNFVFDLSQCNTAADADMIATINAPLKATTADDGTVSYSIDTAESYTLPTGSWFTVDLSVNTISREVEYVVVDLTGTEITSGTLTVPEKNINATEDEEPISMLAEGLFVMTARYQTTMDFDNIQISVETKGNVANPPSVALTRLGKTEDEELDLKMRAYTINFLDGETLHIIGTDGKEISVEWGECEGAYVYETTTSGTLQAWTTCGEATSKVITENVDCTPVVLPTATATISSVSAGFGKTYTLTVSGAEVPLQPTIFLNYEFVGKSGKKVAEDGVASGATVTVDEEGVLSVTSQAYGYQEATMTVDNDLEFATKKVYDFARMTDEEITAAGFPAYEVLNSGTTSGFSNWTARKRLFYYDAATETTNEEGEKVWTAVYPFGFISEDNTTNVMYVSYLDNEDEGTDKVVTNVAGHELFPGIEVYSGHNVSYIKHVGMVNNSTKNGNNKNIIVKDLDETDFVVANTIGSYGSNSNHPVVNTVEEYYAQLAGDNSVYSVAANGTAVLDENEVATGKYTVTIPVYRIDTVCTMVTVFSQVGGGGAVEGVEAEVAGDNYYYTIDGLRLEQPNRPGLYIHNGKKIIVK